MIPSITKCRTEGKTFLPLRWLSVAFLAFPCFFLTVSSPVYATDLSFHPGRAWGMLVGYGFQHSRWVEELGEDVELSFLYPTMIIVSYYQGPLQVHLDLQALLGARTDRRQGILAGGGPVARILYNTQIRVSPYLHLGMGVLYTNIDLKGMGTRMNFFQEAGAGIQFKIHNKLTVSGEYRAMHISNAGLSEDNKGFNTHMVLMGIWYSF